VDQYQLGGQALGQCDGEGQGGEMPEQREDAVVGAGKLADALLDGDTLQLILDSNEERRGDRRPASGSQAARDALARRLRGHNSHGRRGEPRRFAARTHPPGQIDFNNKAVLQARLEPGQFVSLAFGQQARAAGIAQSMGSKGDCFDNAVAESFFATLKKELIHGPSWPSKAELRTEVFAYIEVFFNRRRRHSTLGFLSPEQFETITHHHHLKELQPA
jgi:hypothetical protein